jgi:hypothetical protein
VSQGRVWRFRTFNSRLPTASDPAILERLDFTLLSDEELGILFRYHIHMGTSQCPEAAAYTAFCFQLITNLGEQPTIEAINMAKVKALDRYIHVMGVLPPSHYLTFCGYSYPFHPCMTEALWEVHEKLSTLAVKAHDAAGFDGLLLGYQEQQP